MSPEKTKNSDSTKKYKRDYVKNSKLYREKSKSLRKPDGRAFASEYFNEVEKKLLHCSRAGDSHGQELLLSVIKSACRNLVRDGYDKKQVSMKRMNMIEARLS